MGQIRDLFQIRYCSFWSPERNVLNLIWTNPCICPIWGQTDPLWAQSWSTWFKVTIFITFWFYTNQDTTNKTVKDGQTDIHFHFIMWKGVLYVLLHTLLIIKTSSVNCSDYFKLVFRSSNKLCQCSNMNILQELYMEMIATPRCTQCERLGLGLPGGGQTAGAGRLFSP